MVERPRYVTCSVRKHEVVAVQAFQPHFINEFDILSHKAVEAFFPPSFRSHVDSRSKGAGRGGPWERQKM